MQDGCEIDGVKVSALKPRMTVSFSDTITLNNSPANEREILNVVSYRLKLDLSMFTQCRAVMNVQTAGAANADVHFEGSPNGSNWYDMTPEIAIGATGAKDTDWQELNAVLRADNVLIRMREKEGDGALDPVLRQVLLMFK